MNKSEKIDSPLNDFSAIIYREFITISTSYAILLVLIGGIFIYGFLYNYMYMPNLVRKVPVTIVDDAQTPVSRQFMQLFSASSQGGIYSGVADLQQAKKLMAQGKVQGILYIPLDFDKRLNSGKDAVFILFGKTEAFLNFEAMQEAAAGAMQQFNTIYRPSMFQFIPSDDALVISQISPITTVGTALYNHTMGYGSYLLPGVMVIILFQTLMMVIGMISGKEIESQSIGWYARKGISFVRFSRVILGKTFVYCMLYAIFSIFLLGFISYLFNLPNLGNWYNIVIMMIPFLISTSFFGLTCSIIYTDSEMPLLFIAFLSVALVFLSGISYPMELMPWYWRAVHYMIPATPAALAYVKLNSMGASLSDVSREMWTLWVQVIIYFVLATLESV